MTTLFSRTDQSVLGRWWWTVDRTMLLAFLALVVIGIVLVASASPAVAVRISGAGHDYKFIRNHLIVVAMTIPLMFGMSLCNPRLVWRIASVALCVALVGMVAVLLMGSEVKGARRWIGVFGQTVQPSEFLKPCFAVVIAWLIAKKKDMQTVSISTYLLVGGIFIVSATLLLLQPDVGMTAVVVMILIAELMVAGMAWMWVGVMGGAGVVGIALLYLFFHHFRSRVNKFLHHDATDNYQVDKSVDAFRHGGLTGTGLGQGTVKLSLPDAHADFVFAVAGEEFGLLVIAVIALYGFIVRRGLSRAMDSKDMFVVLAVTGLLTMFGLQAFVNMASAVHLMPTKGMTLPFISYGGSSLLAVGFSAGIVLALTRRQITTGIARGSRFYRREVRQTMPT